MKVFKFGGASVKDAEAVRNVHKILQQYQGEQLVIVISAMGKTTNALEEVVNLAFAKMDFLPKLHESKEYHHQIMQQLFPDKNIEIWHEVEAFFADIIYGIKKFQNEKYDFLYDQIIGFGELISTKIVSAYLSISGYTHIWKDARKLIATDDLYREARVDFEHTNNNLLREVKPILPTQAVLTQGFIGASADGFSTTLGREGSDYTAAIFAAALDAEELVIWKDVPGVLNADPHKFTNAVKFESLTYKDAVEMTYYGASVLHPKTIKPIENKGIPLHVRSFLHPSQTGTIIASKLNSDKPNVPVIILKNKQAIFHISTKDLSFIAEEHISRIFECVVQHGIKVNTMSNSAITFSVCIDDSGQKILDFQQSLQQDFNVKLIQNLQLLTVQNAKEELLQELLSGKNILLEQRSGRITQFVVEVGF